MRLSDNELAELSRRVGFAGPLLIGAVSSALAASGGLAEYEHTVYPGPSAIYQGLWGVDLCEHEHLIGADLTDPWTAALVAYDLTARASSFGWCPAYRSGAWNTFVHRAGVASSQYPGHEPQQITSTLHAVRRTSDQMARDRHDALALIHHRRDVRGPAWQTPTKS